MQGLVWSDVFIFFLFLIFGWFFKSYFGAKAKNFATKEDVQEITKKIESIKHEYATTLESIKGAINSQLYIHQTRYQNEFKILKKLSERLIELRDSALALRPSLDYQYSQSEDIKIGRLTRYRNAANDLYRLYETNRPFYPKNIYGSIRSLHKFGTFEAIQYEDTKTTDEKYWEDGRKNVERISKASNKIIDQIRVRIQSWENFEFKK